MYSHTLDKVIYLTCNVRTWDWSVDLLLWIWLLWKHDLVWGFSIPAVETQWTELTSANWLMTKPGASSSSHRCPTFCYGFRVEQHVSWKRCATGFEIRFLLFGGCVKNVSPISSNVCINHAVLKRQLAQWVQEKSFNMCPLQLGICNNWRY